MNNVQELGSEDQRVLDELIGKMLIPAKSDLWETPGKLEPYNPEAEVVRLIKERDFFKERYKDERKKYRKISIFATILACALAAMIVAFGVKYFLA
jgi:hypothetical protein